MTRRHVELLEASATSATVHVDGMVAGIVRQFSGSRWRFWRLDGRRWSPNYPTRAAAAAALAATTTDRGEATSHD